MSLFRRAEWLSVKLISKNLLKHANYNIERTPVSHIHWSIPLEPAIRLRIAIPDGFDNEFSPDVDDVGKKPSLNDSVFGESSNDGGDVDNGVEDNEDGWIFLPPIPNINERADERKKSNKAVGMKS